MDRLHRLMQVDIAVVYIQLLRILEKNCAIWDIFIHYSILSCPPSSTSSLAHFATINANVMNNALKLPVITHQPFSSEYAKYHFTGKFHASFSLSLSLPCMPWRYCSTFCYKLSPIKKLIRAHLYHFSLSLPHPSVFMLLLLLSEELPHQTE